MPQIVSIKNAATQTGPYKGNPAQEELKAFRTKKAEQSKIADQKKHSARTEKVAGAIKIISSFIPHPNPKVRTKVATKAVAEMLRSNPSTLSSSKEDARNTLLKLADKILRGEMVIDDPAKSKTPNPGNSLGNKPQPDPKGF